MGRRPCCDGTGLNKGAWSTEEDMNLINFVQTQKQCCWRDVPKHAGLLRCGKSCRLRWTNYLRPDLKRGILSEFEENLIIDLHSQLGNRWSKIASHMPGRTDNEIKNLWHTQIKKKLQKMGIDPVTHKPVAPDHHQDKQKDKGQEAQEEIRPNIHDQQDICQEKYGVLLSEELTIPNDFMANEIMEMENDKSFSIDEVPLIESNEFIVPISDHPTLTETPMSTIESVLEDLKCLPIFEDWPTESHAKNYDDENTCSPFDHEFTDWDSLIDDLDYIIGHEINQSPPDITTSTAQEWSVRSSNK